MRQASSAGVGSRSPVSDDGRGLKLFDVRAAGQWLQVRPSVMTGVD